MKNFKRLLVGFMLVLFLVFPAFSEELFFITGTPYSEEAAADYVGIIIDQDKECRFLCENGELSKIAYSEASKDEKKSFKNMQKKILKFLNKEYGCKLDEINAKVRRFSMEDDWLIGYINYLRPEDKTININVNMDDFDKESIMMHEYIHLLNEEHPFAVFENGILMENFIDEGATDFIARKAYESIIGKQYSNSTDYEEAEKIFAMLVESNPEIIKFYFYGKKGEAEKTLEKFEEISRELRENGKLSDESMEIVKTKWCEEIKHVN